MIIEESEVNILEKVKIARSKNKEVVRVVKEIKKVGVKVLRGNKWQIEGDLVLKKSKIYVLKNQVLKVEIIWLYYDIPIVGHGGKWKMMELVMRNYWWLGIMRDVGKYMKGYDMCQRIKNRTEELVRKLKLSKVLEKL